MPYTTFVAGEAVQSATLVGVTAIGPPDHKLSGDTVKLRKGSGTPILMGFGSSSDTKPNGCAVTPSISNRVKPITGPGAVDMVGKGWLDLRLFGGKKLQEGETLDFKVVNTNVNEGAIVAANIAYGSFAAYSPVRGPYKDLFIEDGIITSAADVTYNSGIVSLDSMTDDTSWVDTKAKYDLLGFMPGPVGVTQSQGIVVCSGIGGSWDGYFPGVPIGGLSAVDFGVGAPYTLFDEPIPFDGDAIPSVGLCSTTAAACLISAIIGLK